MIWQPTDNTYTLPGGRILLLQDTYPFELPELPHSEKHIFNYDKQPSEQVWQRQGPPRNWDDLSASKKEDWIEAETRRCFDTGAHIYINGLPIWIPPAYWFTLNWWYTKVGYLDFRVSQLLEEYFEIFCERDRWCIGTFTFKKRRDGKTTRRMARKVWKAIQTQNGWFGLQSKTGKDAKSVCWKILMRGWGRLPTFFIPEVSGMTDPKTLLELKKPSERITSSNRHHLFETDIFRQKIDDDDLNTTLDWRDTVADAYDGQQADEIDLDEFGKWVKASALEAAYTYIQSCTLDGVKVGMIHCYTSPPEKDNAGLKECQEMWDGADYKKIKDLQAFKFYRWLTSSLDSYAGAIDKFGYCDRDKADKMIVAARNAAPASKKKAIVRQTCRSIDEIFESIENDVFITAPEIRTRLNYLKVIEYKDPASKDRKYIYGNFEWVDGIEFGEVQFKPSENQEDFSWTGRWAIIYQPTRGGSGNTWREKMIKGKMCKLPPMDSEFVLGVDPYDFRRTDSAKPSNGAGVIGKCFNFFGNPRIDSIDALYNFRPKDPAVFYADQLKAAIYYGAWINGESRNMKIFDYIEDAGYFEYCLPKDVTNPAKKDIKGTPTTTNTIQEICSLTEALTATALNEVWHEAIAEDWLDFDPNVTKKSNITMAIGHMLIGFSKRRKVHRTERKPLPQQLANQYASALRDAFL